MNNDYLQTVLKELPLGYAYHKIIYDKNGNASDYQFLEVNPAFEIYTGFDSQNIIGKTIREVCPTIESGDFNWISFYGKIATGGGKHTFRHYSEKLQKYYDLTVFSPEIGYIITLFSELSKEEFLTKDIIERSDIHFQNSPIGVLIVTDHFEIQDANQKILQMLQYTYDEILLLHDNDIFAKEHRARSKAFLRRMRKQQIADSALIVIQKNGSTFWAKVFAVKIGEMDQYYLFIEDISKQKEIERDLKRTQTLLKTSLENSPNLMIFSVDADYHYLFFNPIHQEKLKDWFSIESSIGDNFLDVIETEQDKKLLKKELDRALRGESFVHTNRFKGLENILETSYHPMYDEDGTIFGVTCFTKDVTTKVMDQEETKRNEARFHSLFQNMPSGAVIYEVKNNGETAKDYVIKEFNALALHQEEKSIDEIKGRTLAELRPNIETFGLVPVLQKVWQTSETIYIPPTLYKDEQFENWYENQVFKLSSGEVVAVFNDVTDTIRMQQDLKQNEEKYRTIAENTADVIWILNLDLNFDYVSPSMKKVFDICAEDLIHRHLSTIISEEPMQEIKFFINEKLRTERRTHHYESETIIVEEPMADGSLLYIESNINFLRDHENCVTGILGISRNITQRVTLEAKAKKAQNDLQLLLNSTAEGILGFDKDQTCVYVNKRGITLLGYDETELIGKDMRTLAKQLRFRIEGNRSTDYRALNVFRGEEIHLENELLRKKDGTYFPVECYAYPQVENTFVMGAVLTFFDISDPKQQEDDIRYLNYHDILTGLYNRSYFEKEKKHLDAEENLPISVIYVDINGLKIVNDAFGYARGDKQIIETAKVLTASAKKEHILARIGGDEFVILLPKTDEDAAINQMNVILETAAKHNQRIKTKLYHITISLGYATKHDIDTDLNEVVREAEDSMYKRKLLESSSLHSKIIDAMKATLFEKSEETEQHAERLMYYAREVAERMNLTENEKNDIELLAALHDIGKIAIDDRILKKPGKLTAADWVEMKKHPEAGYRIAMSTPVLKPIAGYILAHQEHYDGQGYPNGLAGEEIPLLSRIIAVVDAYDAMTQDRVYRKAMSHSAVVKELKNYAGTQFDPDVVKVFLQLLKEERAEKRKKTL